MTPKPFHYVNFLSDLGLFVTVLLDRSSPYLTSGFGTWNVVQRPKRKSITRYAGRDPLQMDVPVVFDGLAAGKSQEADIKTLLRMSEQPGELQQPAALTVVGPVPVRDRKWVINDLSWDSQAVVWSMDGSIPVRLRQSVVVHLLEYVDDQLITTAPTPAVVASGGKSGSKTKTGSGKTLRQEAQAAYGDPNLYTIIVAGNPWMKVDPRWPIPVGVPFVLPPVHGRQES